MDDKLQILLTGASGTVGLEILKQLFKQKQKYAITIFDLKSKRSLKLLAPYRKDVKLFFGDISNNEDIKKACLNKDFVIHVAAIIPPLADENPKLAFKVNTVGTGNLINNLEQLSPNAFFIYSSSISVYGDRLENPYIKTSDSLKPSEFDEYAKTKIEAERIIQNSKLDWSIFRLTAIMGNHKISKLMFHMPLETPMEIASPEDTAKAFINAIEKKSLISKKIYNLSGGKNCRITYKEFLMRSFKIFGLGELSFPPKTFAEKNFHCGFYEDGDELNEILNFRKDTIDSYFEKVNQSTPRLRVILFSIFRKMIKHHLLKNSEPYNAYINNDSKMIQHFFKVDQVQII